jgi:hypothetical protein
MGWIGVLLLMQAAGTGGAQLYREGRYAEAAAAFQSKLRTDADAADAEYRRYHRTHRRMIKSSKCRPRNSAGLLRVKIHPTRSAQAAFATQPSKSLYIMALMRLRSRRPGHNI